MTWLKPSTLSPDDRAEIINAIEDMAASSRRFVVLLILASIIAALGLLTNSSATIIGAMIVEPSMGPIIGLALGLARFDRDLKKCALQALFVGTVLTFVIGFAIGKLPFDLGVTNEMLVRTRPTLLDMVIALASGLAGAYAFVNPKVNPALAGVAVAVSLAPPLVASGLFCAHGDWERGWGAFLMYLANLICIQAAAVLVFWIYRLGTHRKARRAGLASYIVQFFPYLASFALIGWALADALIVAVDDQRVRTVIWNELKDDPDFWEATLKREAKNQWTIEYHGPDRPAKASISRDLSRIRDELNRPLQLSVQWLPTERIAIP
jgi:uncharacterized hydrophobic protein (TIGR00271 family)